VGDSSIEAMAHLKFHHLGMLNWKGCGRKHSWASIKLLSLNLLGGTEENHKTSVRMYKLVRLYLNPRPSRCEVGVLTTTPDV